MEQKKRLQAEASHSSCVGCSAAAPERKKIKENYNAVMFCCITGSASRTPGQFLTGGVIRRLAASLSVGLSSPPRILVITCTVFVYRGLFRAQ